MIRKRKAKHATSKIMIFAQMFKHRQTLEVDHQTLDINSLPVRSFGASLDLQALVAYVSSAIMIDLKLSVLLLSHMLTGLGKPGF